MIRLYMIVAACAVAMSGATVKGVVRDSVTGEPLAGARVILFGADPQVTGLDGTFEFSKVKPGYHALHGGIEHYFWPAEKRAQNSFVKVSQDDEVADVIISLAPAASIHGFVRTEAGSPIAKARVICMPCETSEVETGPDGRFELNSVHAGPVLLQAWVPPSMRAALGVNQLGGYDNLKVVGGQRIEGLEIRVPSALVTSVSGSVVDRSTGERLVEGAISLAAFEPSPTALRTLRQEDMLENGAFRFEGVVPGSYVLSGRRPAAGRVTAFAQRIEVGEDGVANYRVEMPQGAQLTGRVKHHLGNINVRLAFWLKLPGRAADSGEAEVSPGPDGRFVLEGLAPGTWKVIPLWNGGSSFSLLKPPPSLSAARIRQAGRELRNEIELFAGDNPGFEIEVIETARIRGVVVDSNGNAVSKALVSFPRPGEIPAVIWPSSDGTFGMDLDPGTYEFRATLRDSVSNRQCEASRVKIQPGDKDINVRLQLCH